MQSKLLSCILFAVYLSLSGVAASAMADNQVADTAKAADATKAAEANKAVDEPNLRMVRGVVCETIEDYEPRNVGAVFSIITGRISCYTSFDNVSKIIVVEHRWFRREELVTTKRLTLKPPSWATYSSIQLREADKGPWRVEVRQIDGPLFKTIRFSVTD